MTDPRMSSLSICPLSSFTDNIVPRNNLNPSYGIGSCSKSRDTNSSFWFWNCLAHFCTPTIHFLFRLSQTNSCGKCVSGKAGRTQPRYSVLETLCLCRSSVWYLRFSLTLFSEWFEIDLTIACPKSDVERWAWDQFRLSPQPIKQRKPKKTGTSKKICQFRFFVRRKAVLKYCLYNKNLLVLCKVSPTCDPIISWSHGTDKIGLIKEPIRRWSRGPS